MKTKQIRIAGTVVVLIALMAIPSAGRAQTKSTVPGHPYDISGVWARSIYGAERAQGVDPRLNPAIKPSPLKPGAEELLKKRRAEVGNEDDNCNPRGPLNSLVMTPGAPVEIVQIPGRVFIFVEADRTYRTVWMDQKHDLDTLVPTYMGDSVGHWEGDTLVVDTVNFNGEFYLADFVLSDKLHTVERFRRNASNLLEYSVTIDDPALFTAPWSVTRVFSAPPGWKMGEVYCVVTNFQEFKNKVDLPSKQPGKGQ